MNKDSKTVLVQFKTDNNEAIGQPFDVPIDINVDRLQLICNTFQQQTKNDDQQRLKQQYLFFIQDNEIKTTLSDCIEKFDQNEIQLEKCLEIICAAQSLYHVEAVSRCSSTLEGHSNSIVSVSFSPDGKLLASGSGDTTVRFWDISTETPFRQCKSHKHWVLVISWSPDGQRLASGDKSGLIFIWNTKNGQQIGSGLRGHKQWINALVWEPYHLNVECRRLASASKDTTIKIWDVILGQCLFTLSGHTQNVSSIKWGGTGLIYSGSRDRTIKVWNAENGILCRTLTGHGHWVNTLTLSTEYILRIGSYDPLNSNFKENNQDDQQSLIEKCKKRYEQIRLENERLVSGSDDFTLFLWNPETSKKSLSRMTGHQQLVNDVKFSPNGRLIASASFDKSIKLWNGFTGKFLQSLRGHVNAVYQISWSSDNRLLASCSADSTIKIWNIMNDGKLLIDLPGHSDEVYALDWSTDGYTVASGGKDRLLKIWKR